MKILLAIHHNSVDVQLTDAGLAELLEQTSASSKRFWVADETQGEVRIRRSSYGYRMQAIPRVSDWRHRLQCPRKGVVRHHSTEVEAVWEGQALVYRLPPEHLWPWIQDQQAKATFKDKRERAIAEINARILSARGAQDLLPALPFHITRLLLPDETRAYSDRRLIK